MKKLEFIYCIALGALIAVLLVCVSADAEAEEVVTLEPPTIDYSGLKHPKQYDMLYTEDEVRACAKLIYGEYGADWVTDTEKAKVVCTLVNRTHSPRWIAYVGSADLMAQLTYPDQFYYYPSFPVSERHYRIAYDVLWRASKIAQGAEDVTWETDALRYWGDGVRNHFY